MAGRIVSLVLCFAALGGCECGSKPESGGGASTTPPNFDEVMAEHAGLSVAARNALIRGDLPVAQQAMRKLAFFMEHVPFPDQGKEYARVTKELANEVRQASDVEEASMAFARLSHACGQCHHALDRGPPTNLDPTPEGKDLAMHMRRHYWAVERMWEALLAHSPRAFQSAARQLAEAPLLGSRDPDSETPSGTTRLAYEVHDLAFAAAVEGNNAEDDYVPNAGERREAKPTSRGQAEIFGQILAACSQCHTLVGAEPAFTLDERRERSR